MYDHEIMGDLYDELQCIQHELYLEEINEEFSQHNQCVNVVMDTEGNMLGQEVA